MLRITVELLPWGIESKAKILGKIKVINNGKGDHKNGRYNIEVEDDKGAYDFTLSDSYPRSYGWIGLMATVFLALWRRVNDTKNDSDTSLSIPIRGSRDGTGWLEESSRANG